MAMAQNVCRRRPARYASNPERLYGNCLLAGHLAGRSGIPSLRAMRRTALCLGVAVVVSGCMPAQQSFSGLYVLGDPPHYQTYGDLPPVSTLVGHLRIKSDVGVENSHVGSGPLVPLLDAMNSYLDSARWSAKLNAAPSDSGAPWAYVGSDRGLSDWPLGGGDPKREGLMVIQALGPTRRWADQLRAIADSQHVGLVFALFLGVSEYYPTTPGGPFTHKEVALGTGYAVRVGYLSPEDRPVEVLQLTGLLLSRDGTVLRAGAEGIFAKPPSVALGLIHMTSRVSKDDVANVLTSLRRDDLEGHPLAWRVALHNLVRQLLGAP